MPTWFDGAPSSRFDTRRMGKIALMAGLSLMTVASGASAFGLEPLTIGASRVVAKDTAAALVVATTRPQVRPETRLETGLVSQDRSTLDVTQLSMSAFGDADESSR